MECCYLLNLETVDYQEGLNLQMKLADLRSREEIPDTLILLEHPPVITFGKKAQTEYVKSRVTRIPLTELKIPSYDIDRGGSVVCHEPGQLIGYPILNYSNLIKRGDWKLRLPLLGRFYYINGLEEVMISTANSYGIETRRKPPDRHSLRNVGVWYFTDGRHHKVGYTGISIKSFAGRRVTIHGFALNVNNDLSTFGLIYSCGLMDKEDTSLARILGHELPMNEVRRTAAMKFAEVFGYELKEVELKDLPI